MMKRVTYFERTQEAEVLMGPHWGGPEVAMSLENRESLKLPAE